MENYNTININQMGRYTAMPTATPSTPTISPIRGDIYDIQLEMITVSIQSIIAYTRRFMTAKADSSTYALGTALYRKTRHIPIYTFDPKTGGITAHTPTNSDIVKCELNIFYAVSVIYPTTDFVRLGEMANIATISQISERMAMSARYTLDFDLLQFISNYVADLNTSIPTAPVNQIVFFDDNKASAGNQWILSSDQIQKNLVTMGLATSNMAKTFDANISGINDRTKVFRILLDSNAGTALAGGVSRMTYAIPAFEMLLKGGFGMEGEIYDIMGHKAQEWVFFDRAFAKSVPQAETPFGSKTYDFSNILGVIYYEGCFAQPYAFNEHFMWRDATNLFPTQNMRFCFGMAIIWPSLFRLILRKGTTLDVATKTWKNTLSKNETQIENLEVNLNGQNAEVSILEVEKTKSKTK